jgi:ABC-type dipeptide/oligopeptide/nickel transport system ATPase component
MPLLSRQASCSVCLALALVPTPRLLLLDEATSNLHIDTETAVWKTIEAGGGERTTIFVTHRLRSSARADWICYLGAGTVLEEDTFDDLLARKVNTLSYGSDRTLWTYWVMALSAPANALSPKRPRASHNPPALLDPTHRAYKGRASWDRSPYLWPRYRATRASGASPTTGPLTCSR